MVGNGQAWQAAVVPSSGGKGAAKSTEDLLQRRPGHCPKGHKLSKWIARRGTCDGCGRGVEHGERVMDCRDCNWYLCRSCLLQPPDEGLWGTFTYLTDMAAQEASGIAAELSALVPSCSAPAKASLISEELQVGPEVKPAAGTTQPEQPITGGHLPGLEEVIPGPKEGAMEGEAVVERPAVADAPDLLDLSEDLLGLDDPTPSAASAVGGPPPRLPAPPAGRPIILAPPAGAPAAPTRPLDIMLLNLEATTAATAGLPHVPAGNAN